MEISSSDPFKGVRSSWISSPRISPVACKIAKMKASKSDRCWIYISALFLMECKVPLIRWWKSAPARIRSTVVVRTLVDPGRSTFMDRSDPVQVHAKMSCICFAPT